MNRYKFLPPACRFIPRRSPLLRRCRVAQYFRLPRQDQKGSRTPRHVLRFQNSRRFPLQGETAAEKETYCECDVINDLMIFHTNRFFFCCVNLLKSTLYNCL